MKSAHARLDPQKEEVLKVCDTFGQFHAMDRFKIKSVIAFRAWLKDVTGNENYGIAPKLRLDNRQTLGDQLVNAFIQKVADLQDQLKEKNKRIDFLEWQLSQGNDKEISQSLSVLEACKVGR